MEKAKVIKEIVKELEMRYKINILTLSLVGSRSTGLSTPKSDIDLYAVIEPTLENLVTGNTLNNGKQTKLYNVLKLIVEEEGIEPEVDVNIVDWGTFIRNFTDKISINFVQSQLGILYTKNKEYGKLLHKVMSDTNLSKEFSRVAYFSFQNNFKRLTKEHTYTGSKAQYETEYGINLKDLSNTYLFMQIAQKTSALRDIYNLTDSEKEVYFKIRSGEITEEASKLIIEEAQKFLREKSCYFHSLKSSDKSQYIKEISKILLKSIS